MKYAELVEIICAEIGDDAGHALCAAICRRAARERLYIPDKHEPPPVIAPNDTPAVVARRHGIARSTAYNWVNRWRR